MTSRRIVRVFLLLSLMFIGCGGEKGKVCSIDWGKQPEWNLDTIAVAQEVEVSGVWGVSKSEIYAVGMVDSGQGPIGVVWKYNGAGWSEVYARPNADLRDIQCLSSNSIWVAGMDNPDVFPGQALVLHWDGHVWKESLVEATIGGLLAIWAAGNSNVFAVDRSRGAILHYDGTWWDEEDTPVQDDPPFALHDQADIWGTRDGSGLTVYAGLAMGNIHGVVLRKTAQNWNLDFPRYYPESGTGFVGVWAEDSVTVFALDRVSRGRILPDAFVYQRADTGWASVPLFIGSGLFSGLRGDGKGSVFVFGERLYRVEGTSSTRYEDYPWIFIEDIWIHEPGIVAIGQRNSSLALALFGDFSTCHDK